MARKTQRNNRRPSVVSKHQYREQTLVENLQRYTDHERFSVSKPLVEAPNLFLVLGIGRPCCAVEVNWEAVQEVLLNKLRVLLPESDVVKDDSTRRPIAEVAMYHVLEFLPQKLDSALDQMADEALLALIRIRAIDLGLQAPPLADLAERIVEAEEQAVKDRIGVCEGPQSFFMHRSHYEIALEEAMTALLAEGEVITQGNVAQKFAEKRPDASIDERNIRRWNEEYGSDWKAIKKRLSNRTNS